MHLLCGFVILAYHAALGLPAPVTYDQRQTGDLNVQLHLKDVTVLALLDAEGLDDYTEYDYFYDYADFTVKPMAKPSSKPTTANSVEATTIASTTETISVDVTFEKKNSTSDLVAQNATNDGDANAETSSTNRVEATTLESVMTASPASLNSSQDDSPLVSDENSPSIGTTISDKTGNPFDSSTTVVPSSIARRPGNEGTRKRCKSGYSPNGRGRCRLLNRRRFSLIPIMKLAPQLLGGKSFDSKDLS